MAQGKAFRFATPSLKAAQQDISSPRDLFYSSLAGYTGSLLELKKILDNGFVKFMIDSANGESSNAIYWLPKIPCAPQALKFAFSTDLFKFK